MMKAHVATRSRGSISLLANAGTAAFSRWVALLVICLGVLPAGEATAQEPATQPAATTEPVAAGAPATQPGLTGLPATMPAGTAELSAAEGSATQPGATSRPTTMPAEKGLLLNFRNASLQAVLEYLSEAAGLVILNGADAEGRVTIMSRNRVDTAEAIALLDTLLKEKGYTAIRTGRLLKIVTLAQAAKENLPVHSGSDPSEVPVSDRLVTQVIPIRYADAARLRTDLTPLMSATATLTANQASNSLILIDTQTNIRRIMQIIRALDGHMAGVAEVRVYRLKFADATSTGRLITELFRQDQQDQQAGQRVFMPFGRFGRGDRGRGGGGQQQDDQAGGRQQRVTATADERTNTLVVSAPPDMLTMVDGIIKELDSDPTEEQSVFIYPLKNAQAKNLETVLGQIFSETGTAAGGRATGGRATTSRFGGRSSRFGGTTALPTAGAGAGDLAGQVFIVADEDTNSLIVRTAAKYVERVKEILTELDRPIRQVLIKVLIAEVTHDETLDLGTEFSALNLQFGTTGTVTVDFGTAEESGGVVTATMNAGLSATFNALHRLGKLDVLSRPYILASDNQEASFTVGQEVPRIQNTRITDTGQTVNTIQYEDVGIILSVTPHINPEGLVIMDIAPEISTLTDTTVLISETLSAQVIAKRTAQTRVAVSDGQTIVIGGLMENRVVDDVRKVPILGDIPLLGLLFRRKFQSKVKTELLIFLTPRVARQPEELKKISEAEEKGSETVQDAVESGAFDKHMRAMRRGTTSRPAGGKNETPR